MDGVLILNGQIRFTIEPTADVGTASTSGRSRHTKPSNQAKSIACALKRRKEARSVKEGKARAPVEAEVRLGPSLSEMTPTTKMVIVVIVGKSNLDRCHLMIPFTFNIDECASKNRVQRSMLWQPPKLQ